MPKKGKLIRSPSDKMYYSHAEIMNHSVKNRTKKLKSYVDKNPNDLQAKKALNKGLVYRRKRSVHKIWSRKSKEFASLLKTIGYKKSGDLALKILKQEYNIIK